jgi:hypothetical protein
MEVKEKPNDFGGIPTRVYSKILEFGTPPLAPGVTDAMAARVLFELARERHAALRPGTGRTGFVDAYKAFEELDQAMALFQKPADAEMGTVVDRLGDAIAALAGLWAKGPVADEFFSQ